MDREALIEKLRSSFSLYSSQIPDIDGNGYKLQLRAEWPVNDCEARGFRVQLTGINPLTGEDVEQHGVIARFSFDRVFQEIRSLTYHGNYVLRCTAVMRDGEEIVFKEQKIKLNYPANTPYVEYEFTSQGEFMQVELRSNCWMNARGKVWVGVDGRMQRINLPMDHMRRVRFYLPTGERPEINVQDDNIILRNGRL